MNIPPRFRQPIKVTYPPNNSQIFEEWFIEQWYARSMQVQCQTERELLPISFTSCYVNNNYGNDKEYIQALQVFLDDLPTDKKYFCIVQYDDGILNDVSHLDLLQFHMSKNIGYQLPLLAMPHPYKFDTTKKYVANFIGSHTHPIREKIFALQGTEGFYISDAPHDIEQYCKIISESIFTLCPRGYGLNSFRIKEAIEYGSIPVYISDEWVLPKWMNFQDYGILVGKNGVDDLVELLTGTMTPERIIYKQNLLKEVYEKYYTYESNLRLIIQHLKNETPVYSNHT